MSDAPERLWVWYDQEDGWVGVDEDVSQWDATEYVRADRIAELEAELRAAVEREFIMWAEFTDDQREKLRYRFSLMALEQTGEHDK